jgi:two-component system, cell cycle response regulator
MKILIAEDDVVSRRVLAANLEKWGHEVVVAADGAEAWEIFQREDVGLAILDWMMPEMDGLEVCRRIRATEGREYVYIIFLTAKEGKSDIVTGLDSGADDYVIKPFHKDELQSRVKVGKRMVELERSLQSANRKLKILSITDSLTEFYNHGAILSRFAEEMERRKRECRPVSMIMADLDHFKRVNDTYGHQAGDKVLLEVARRIKSACRQYDNLGRYGGEEFLIILPGTDEREAQVVAERLHESVRSEPFDIGTEKINVTISQGLGTVPWDLEIGEDEVIRAADAALYRAKEEGRDRVVIISTEDLGRKPVNT